MKLGMVTWNIAAEWDVDTIIANCRASGFQGVELRTTHKHGVEEGLSKSERRDVRRKFEDGGVRAYGLGTAFEFHSTDRQVLRQNIEGSKRYIQLASDLGIEGVKVRPNTLPKDVPESTTLSQIGHSFREVAACGAENGIKVWMEVHGHETCRVDRMRRIVDLADHPNARLTFNCNAGETDAAGSCRSAYELLRDKIGCVHLHELWEPTSYPYGELIKYLKKDGYDGWTGYEGVGSSDPVTLMKCYRRIWELLLASA